MAEEAQGNEQESSLPEAYQGKSTQEIYAELQQAQNRLQELGKYETINSQVEQYGGIDALVNGYNTLYQRYVADNAQRQQQQQAEQPTEQRQQAMSEQTSQQTPRYDVDFTDWELLTPREQAARLQQSITQQVAPNLQNYVQTMAQQYAEAFKQAQEQQAQAMRREWDIYRQVFEAARENPDLDMQRLMTEMVSVATGDSTNLIELAKRNLTAEQDAERRAQQLYEAKLADLEQQRANEAMQVLTGNPNGPLHTSQAESAPKNVREENAMIAKKLVEEGILTPGHFAP